MSKRRLTKQQSRRIASRQTVDAQKARKKNGDLLNDDAALGPEQEGLVISHFGTQVDIEDSEKQHITRCHLRANLGNIVTGDHVAWRASDSGGVVTSRLPRTNEFQRPDSYGKLKLIAANISQVFIVIAGEPAPHANLIDRYLVAIEHFRIEPILLLNKTDLSSCDDAFTLIEPYKKLGYSVVTTCAKQCESLDTLKNALSGSVSIFVGQSGVGKSSLLQTLLPNEDIKIGKLSEAALKGRHTTTHARLYHFADGGSCIDSPGIREFGLWHLDANEVAQGFVEFRDFIHQCRFRDCKHDNEPGCALKSAVESGEISKARFESFKHIVETLDAVSMNSTTSK